jgi:hypothetical protein
VSNFELYNILTLSDFDECSEGNFSGCPGASCINTQGSYNCQCENGYAWDGKQECLGMKSPKKLCFKSIVNDTTIAKLDFHCTINPHLTSKTDQP